MFRLPVTRSAALVSATVATRGITQRPAQPDENGKRALRNKENVVHLKEKPIKDVNQKDQQEKQGSKTGKGRN
jgi:hypothetical protein